MKKITLETNKISSRQELKDSLSLLVNFQGWNNQKVNEWLDLILVSDKVDPQFARFSATKAQQFSLEVKNSRRFLRKQPDEFGLLVNIVQRINNQSIKKSGNPLFSLVLL